MCASHLVKALSGERASGANEALVDAVATALGDAQTLSRDASPQQALVEIAAALAAMNVPPALALQKRMKQPR